MTKCGSRADGMFLSPFSYPLLSFCLRPNYCRSLALEEFRSLLALDGRHEMRYYGCNYLDMSQSFDNGTTGIFATDRDHTLPPIRESDPIANVIDAQ